MSLTKEEHEHVQIANLAVWLQMAVFAADEAANVKWFNRNRTKYALKSFTDIVIRDYGDTLKKFWDVPEQLDMPDVCNRLTRFAELITSMDFLEMEECAELIDKHLKQKRNGNI